MERKMTDTLVTNLISIQTTTRCTLRCKKCSCSFPSFVPAVDEDIDVIKESLESIFKVYDRVEELRIAGAEAFLYPQIEEVIVQATKFRKKFELINIVTNGTYVPKMSVIDTISRQDCRILIRIDNYGSLSARINDLIKVLEENQIEYEVRNNFEGDYFCDGWIDFGTEYEDKHYTDKELKKLFFSCRNRSECKMVWGGVLYACGFIVAGYKLGKIPIAEHDYVDLLTPETTIVEKRAKAAAFTEKAFEGCKYCNGFDPVNSKRIPAAEQE